MGGLKLATLLLVAILVAAASGEKLQGRQLQFARKTEVRNQSQMMKVEVRRSCSSDEFTCNDQQQCISKLRFCDGLKDCYDHSDESAGCAASCSEDQFKCKDQTHCIKRSHFCDGVPDCSDDSDEDDAICLKKCNKNDFVCNNDQCIDNFRFCDGVNDCNDRSDELADCSKDCYPDQFECKDNKFCIRKANFCDGGSSDCDDNSDEPAACQKLCSSYQFACRNTTQCVSISQYCDGTTDCTDGADEQGCSPSQG